MKYGSLALAIVFAGRIAAVRRHAYVRHIRMSSDGAGAVMPCAPDTGFGVYVLLQRLSADCLIEQEI